MPVLAVLAQLGAALGCWRLALWWGLGVPASAIAAATCCCLPVVLALGGSGFSEPIGGFVLVLILLLRESLLRETMGVEPAKKRGRLGWLRVFGLGLGLLAASALAPVVRRELAAVVVVPLVALVFFGVGRIFRNARRGFSVILSEFLILAGVALSVCLVGEGYASQEVLGLAEPFSVKNWLQLFPRFVWHLFDWRMYGPFGTCLVVVLFFPKRARAIAPALGLYAVFVTAFTGFSQSYYFVVAGEDPGFHFLRYSLEVAPLMALICGAAADGLGAWVLRFSAAGAVAARRVATGGVAVILASTIAFGGAARRRFSEEEEAVRLMPVKRALAMLPSGATLISGWGVLVSLLGGDGQRVLAFESIGDGVSGDRLRAEVEDENVFYFTRTNLSAVDRHRYRNAHRVLDELGLTDCCTFVSGDEEYFVCRVLREQPRRDE